MASHYFGDFTEADDSLFSFQDSSVELPFSWTPSNSAFTKHDGNIVSPSRLYSGDLDVSLETKDENHNHVKNDVGDWTNDTSVSKKSEKLPTALNRIPAKTVYNNAAEKMIMCFPEQPVGPRDSSVPPILPEIKGTGRKEVSNINRANEQTENFEMESRTSQSANEPLVNGHPETDSMQTCDNDEFDIGNQVILNADGTPNGVQSSGLQENSHNDNKNDDQSAHVNGPKSDPPDSELVKSSPTKASDKPSSWASLFSGGPAQPSKRGQPAPFVEGGKNVAAPPPKEIYSIAKKKQAVTSNGLPPKQPITTTVVNIEDDTFSKQMADQILHNELVYRSPGLMPHGFLNSSNWCYINATLQALLTCSPFCHLMRSLPSRQASPDNNIVTSTPILDSFVRLVKELKPLPKRNIQRNAKEQWYGAPCEPEYIYKMLSTIKSNLSEMGRQEDAEEFLSCVLNGLHEEMLKLSQHYNTKPQSQMHQDDVVLNSSQTELGYEVPVHDEDPSDESHQDQEDQWEEVIATRKNRGSVTRRADISKTPVSDVFRGELRSDLHQDGQRGSATLEPFFTLPLDINDQKTWSVNDALEALTRTESVQDFTNSKTKAKVDATRRQTLETLPPVLILHLKRFIYDKTGGSMKLDKEIQYHTDLVIGKELLSKPAKKIAQDKRSYKLFAVVYHHGKKSTGGHYTTDVYHDGLGCWLRIDDQYIKTTNVHEVVRHNSSRTAYLLYYKRTDLMSVFETEPEFGENNHDGFVHTSRESKIQQF